MAATATTHRLVNQEPRVAFWINRLHLRRSSLADDPFGDRKGLADLEPGRSDLQGWMESDGLCMCAVWAASGGTGAAGK